MDYIFPFIVFVTIGVMAIWATNYFNKPRCNKEMEELKKAHEDACRLANAVAENEAAKETSELYKAIPTRKTPKEEYLRNIGDN